MPIEMIEEFKQGARIKVIGVGGGGGNAIEHMMKAHVGQVEFIAANTDAQALGGSHADFVVQLGETGLGAGSNPAAGKEAAEEARERIREVLDGADMVFITAGMGGGTGTGAAPVVAQVAKEMGILTVGVVTKPFEYEGQQRTRIAEAGLAELEANVDSLIVVLNERLLEVLGDDATVDQAFSFGNDVLKSAVGGISDVIHKPALVNLDFRDVCKVMEKPGKALMGTASATGPDRAAKAAEAAMACPLLDGVNLAEAEGLLVLVTASRATLKLSEQKKVMQAVSRLAHADAHIKTGLAYDDALGDALCVTLIATGLSASKTQRQTPVLVETRRTGTDNMPVLTQAVGADTAPTGAMGHFAGLSQASGRTAVGFGGDYGDRQLPSVWRTGRPAQKVEALAASGLDDIEIPAFLRRQAD
jgi:cell division protein FtsZ